MSSSGEALRVEALVLERVPPAPAFLVPEDVVPALFLAVFFVDFEVFAMLYNFYVCNLFWIKTNLTFILIKKVISKKKGETIQGLGSLLTFFYFFQFGEL